MRRPAAVSAAAATVLLLALLGPGLSSPAEDSSEADFTLCSHCFYRQKPPQGASAELLLSPLCHSLPGGRVFASLSRQACDTAVYSAFHLRHGWMEGEEEGEEPELSEEQNSKIAIPALLGKYGDTAYTVSPPDSPLHNWDSTITTLVRSSISPQCNTLEGDLYILMGAGSIGAVEDGEEQCQTEPLWSAVCCTGPEGKGGFSVGIIQEAEAGLRRVSVKELEGVLGVSELFFEGCGDADDEALLTTMGLYNVEQVDQIQSTEADDGQADRHTDGSKVLERRRKSSITEEKANDLENDEDLTQEASTEESSGTSGDSLAENTQSGAVRSASSQLETEDEQETNSSSTVVYILATTLYMAKAPLHPIFSRITQFPQQVSYVLQEDLGVLCALPGDTCNLLYLLTSDLVSGIWSTIKSVLGIVYNSFYNVYYCTSSMLGVLLNCCYTGVTGTGTLLGDALGIFGDTVGNAWWVTKRFGGGLCQQSGGYLGTVSSEMGSQALTMGGGLGRLVWRFLEGVIKAFTLVAGFIIGLIDLVFGGVGWLFWERSE